MNPNAYTYSAWAAARLRAGASLDSLDLDRLTAPWLEWVGVCRMLNGGDRRAAFDTWAHAHPDGTQLIAEVFDQPIQLTEFPDDVRPPAAIDPLVIDVTVPDLPAKARLTPALERAAAGAGQFLDLFTGYILEVVNTLPREMAEAAALTVVSMAVARRLCLPTYFDDLYPILWTLWIAPSTVFHKTTALNLVRRLIREVMPHLLLPQESSNDRLLQNMAGIQPSNYDQLSLFDQEQWRLSARFAGQRGIVVDEASSVFGSFDKEYNRGKIETFLTAFDCEEQKVHETNKHGAIYLRHLYMPFLGATTPVSIQFANTTFMWESGFWPRFTLLVPERLFPAKSDRREGRVARPPELEQALRRLLHHLPEPAHSADPHAPPEPPQALTVTLEDGVWAHWQEYNEALSYEFQHPERVPDYRLRLIGGRLPVKLLRVALLLAALDWQPEQASAPRITLGHYARAHQITEGWRVNAYRFVELMNRRPDSAHHEQRLVEAIQRLTEAQMPATTRELVRLTHWERELVETLLRQMEADGAVERERSQSRRTEVWKVVANAGH